MKNKTDHQVWLSEVKFKSNNKKFIIGLLFGLVSIACAFFEDFLGHGIGLILSFISYGISVYLLVKVLELDKSKNFKVQIDKLTLKGEIKQNNSK